MGASALQVPTIAVGCMRINTLKKDEAEHFVQTALELGANFFDHADIYGDGECEEIFAEAVHMSATVREGLILQSKCGIRKQPQQFDFSKEHILASVDDILRRLKTEYLDVLLLHRPDALVEPDEVGEAFDKLYTSGKVRHFGMSNQNPMQLALLQKAMRQPIVANQLQYSITNCNMVSSGINVNMENTQAACRDGGVLDYCRLHDITIQAWSPFQYGFFDGVFIGSDRYTELNRVLDELAMQYKVSSSTIAIAWILRHPAKMQPIVGTMNAARLRDICRAATIELTRAQWYEIYLAAGNILP